MFTSLSQCPLSVIFSKPLWWCWLCVLKGNVVGCQAVPLPRTHLVHGARGATFIFPALLTILLPSSSFISFTILLPPHHFHHLVVIKQLSSSFLAELPSQSCSLPLPFSPSLVHLGCDINTTSHSKHDIPSLTHQPKEAAPTLPRFFWLLSRPF